MEKDLASQGIGFPRPRLQHQRLIMQTIRRMCDEIMAIPGWEILPEATVTDNPYDRYPDIVVFDENRIPVMTFEFCLHKQIPYNKRKGYILFERFPEATFFIYDYERQILLGMDREHPQWVDNREVALYSPYLKYPIMDYILGSHWVY